MRHLKILAIMIGMYACAVTCNATQFGTMVHVNIPMCQYSEIPQEEYEKYPILQMFSNNQNPLSPNLNYDLKWYGNFVDALLVDVQKFNDAVFKDFTYKNNTQLAECLKYMFFGIIRTIKNRINDEVNNNLIENNTQYKDFDNYLFNICGQVFMSDRNAMKLDIANNPYQRKYKTIERCKLAFEYVKLEVKDSLTEDKDLEYNTKFAKYSDFRYRIGEIFGCMYYLPNTSKKSQLSHDMEKYSEELVKQQIRQDNLTSNITSPVDSYISKYKKDFNNLKKRQNEQINKYNDLDYAEKFHEYSVFRNELGKLKGDVIDLPNTKQKRELINNMQKYDQLLTQEQMRDDDDYSDYSDDIDEEVSTNKVTTNQFKPNTMRN